MNLFILFIYEFIANFKMKYHARNDGSEIFRSTCICAVFGEVGSLVRNNNHVKPNIICSMVRKPM